jgi:hypothetical protein
MRPNEFGNTNAEPSKSDGPSAGADVMPGQLPLYFLPVVALSSLTYFATDEPLTISQSSSCPLINHDASKS